MGSLSLVVERAFVVPKRRVHPLRSRDGPGYVPFETLGRFKQKRKNRNAQEREHLGGLHMGKSEQGMMRSLQAREGDEQKRDILDALYVKVKNMNNHRNTLKQIGTIVHCCQFPGSLCDRIRPIFRPILGQHEVEIVAILCL